jgi:hypothetical protein
MAFLSFLDRETSVAHPGYSRWLAPPAALGIHCSSQDWRETPRLQCNRNNLFDGALKVVTLRSLRSILSSEQPAPILRRSND